MITINHISVRNFMSIKELELDFDPNMIMAITGFNGSGKSPCSMQLQHVSQDIERVKHIGIM